MIESQRRNYLNAMQIDTWLPRTVLPFAAPSHHEVLEAPAAIIVPNDIIVAEPLAVPASKPETTPTAARVKPVIKVEPKKSVATPTIKEKKAPTVTPRFALQLMQAGNCLLLVELSTGEAFQMNDPTYQLLRNILKAAKLPDSPQWLGDVIRWPLFKQASITQGAKEAQEFLQSVITTQQAQLPNCNCLWLIGLPAIRYAAGLEEQNYFQTPDVNPLGKTLLVPSLELLIENPQHKASLWKTLRELIPSWS